MITTINQIPADTTAELSAALAPTAALGAVRVGAAAGPIHGYMQENSALEPTRIRLIEEQGAAFAAAFAAETELDPRPVGPPV